MNTTMPKAAPVADTASVPATPQDEAPEYIPPVDDAADEAMGRLYVVLHMMEGLTNDSYDERCEGYEISVIEDTIRDVIALLKRSVQEHTRKRRESAES